MRVKVQISRRLESPRDAYMRRKQLEQAFMEPYSHLLHTSCHISSRASKRPPIACQNFTWAKHMARDTVVNREERART